MEAVLRQLERVSKVILRDRCVRGSVRPFCHGLDVSGRCWHQVEFCRRLIEHLLHCDNIGLRDRRSAVRRLDADFITELQITTGRNQERY